MKWPVIVVLCLVAGAVAWALKPVPDVAAAVSQARRAAGDSATAAVSDRYLREIVQPLKDTIRVYQGHPIAAARIVIRRDTIQHTDTVRIQDLTPDSAVIDWEPLDTAGVQMWERLIIAPAPLPNTLLTRYLHLSITPDTILAALLKLPDGSQRFAAIASSQGYTRVVDAAVRPERRSRFGFGCTAGPSLTVTLGGQAYGGAGVTCGLQLRF